MIVFTLCLNLLNLFFVKDYDNMRLSYKSSIELTNDRVAVQEICSDFAKSSEHTLVYKDITLWAFYSIFVSTVLVLIIFILEKSKKILLTEKDWKLFRFFIMAIFLSAFIFAYSGWILADDYYLNACLK